LRDLIGAGTFGAALTVIHRSDAMHWDLKPANILLDDEGNVYLGEFRIAKALVKTAWAMQESQIIESSADDSPERIKGKQ
jgi:serine/threonine protein kinase